MQPGYFQGNPPPYQRPGSSAPPNNFQQGPPPPRPPPPWPGGPQAGTPQNFGTPYQYSPAHAPSHYPQQPWSGPPPSAPPASHVSTTNYNPNSYGLMPNSFQSSVSPIRQSQNMGALGSGPFNPGPGYPQPTHHVPNQQYGPGGPPHGPQQSNPAQPYGTQGPPFHTPARMQQPYPPPQQDKPPLPPRPGSAIQHHQSQSYPMAGQSPHPPQQPGVNQGSQQNRQSYLASALGQGRGDHYNQANPYIYNVERPQIPPLPPPLPQGYQIEVLQNQQGQPQHPPYSHQPPTHHYEPPVQNSSVSMPFNGQAQGLDQVQGEYGTVGNIPTSQTPGAPDFQPSAPSSKPASDISQSQMQHALISTPAGAVGGTPGLNTSQPYFTSSSHTEQPISSYHQESSNAPAGVVSPPSSESGVAWAQQQQFQSAPPQPLQQFEEHRQNGHGSIQQTLYLERPPSTIQKTSFQPSSDQNQQNLQPILNRSSQPGLTGQHGHYEQPQQHVRSEHGQQPPTTQFPSPGLASESGHGHDRRNNPIAREVQTAPVWDQRYPPNMPSETAPNPEYHPTPPSTGHSQQPSGSSFHASNDIVASNQAKVPLDSQRPDSVRLHNPASTATIDAGTIKSSTHKEVSQEEEGISQKQKPASDHSGVSALGTGGPSDWEHFGVSEVDEIDDTAMFAGKKPDAQVTPMNDFAELSSQPSPTVAVKQHSESSHISNPSEMWPTPPPLAPLKLHGQTAGYSPPNTDNQHEQTRFIPTPPLGTHHNFDSQDQDRGNLTTEHDRHGNIDEALQTWALPDKPVGNVDQTRSQFSGMPNLPDQSSSNAGSSWPEESKEQKTVIVQQPQKNSGIPHHNKNQLEHDRNHTQSPPTQSFVIGDGSWSRETAKQRTETSSPALMSEATSAQAYVPPPQSQQPGSSLSHTSTQTDAPDTYGLLQEAPNHQATIATSPESNPLSARKDHLPKSLERPQDPYDHLEPWYKESLERYATMLESEAQAATDQERTKIFTEFMMAESRLRGVRYGSAVGNWATPRSEPSDFTKKQPTLNQTQETGGAFSSTKPQVERVPSPISSAESYVVIDSPDDGDFSPGGRPRLIRVAPDAVMHPSAKPNVNSDSKQTPALASPVLEQGPVPTPRSRSDDKIPHNSIISQGPSTTAERPFSPPSTNSVAPASNPVPEEPAYKPFRYNAEPSHRLNASERKVNRSPQPTDVESTRLDYKAYSPNKNSSADKATASQPVPATAPPTQYMGIAKGTRAQAGPTKSEHAKAPANEIIGLQAPRGSPPLANQARQVLSEPQKHAQSYIDDSVSSSARGLILELRSILPSSRGQTEMSARRLDPVKQASQSIADDFQFIEDLTQSWNLKAKNLRDKNEHDRRIRQEEQDEHTSRLFDEEAIGYGDLGALDDEFKQSETEKKAQEDRAEYQDFVENVFDPVYNRLQEQIQKLMEQYIYCSDLMKEAVTGKEGLEPHGDRPDLTLVMDAVLDLHRKIELRHWKVSEALLNRDRRFGKTEVQLLYHISNVTKMKQMERHFADAEKRAILDAANKCDERAKGLLDIVEENTIRAVEINQDYMDEIMQTIRKSEGLAPRITGSTRDSDDLQRELSFAQGVLRSLTTTSERFMQQFYETSCILNTAEHDALIAESRLADADTATLARLNEEQKMEETRLKQELNHRLAIVRDDSKKANEYIESLLTRPKRSDGSSSPKVNHEESVAPDPEHQERIKKALEAAKKRNTAKSPDVYAAPE
ncbi:MAG: hypothetical protein M1835_006516 [Candelina submexicana]|nr:MAG: hypothetical protein M1835_006516 [Candelina submexicana]